MKLRQCDATVRAKAALSNHPTRDISRVQREILPSGPISEIVRADVIKELFEFIEQLVRIILMFFVGWVSRYHLTRLSQYFF